MFSKSGAPRQVSSLLRSRTFRRPIRFGLQLLPFICVAPLILYVILAYAVRGDPRLLPTALQSAKNLLIVTAHPDDECLFFSPSILGVLEGEPKTTGGLLVLSTGKLSLFLTQGSPLKKNPGNNYGVGEMRKLELKGSCEALGIDATRCVALDRAELQDNPKVWWNQTAIVSAVKEYVDKWKIDAVSNPDDRLHNYWLIRMDQILTFDDGGISGHINHRAVSAAVRYVKH